jgi:hypothetical protein
MLEAIQLRINPGQHVTNAERFSGGRDESPPSLPHYATLSRHGRNNRLRCAIREAAAPTF